MTSSSTCASMGTSPKYAMSCWQCSRETVRSVSSDEHSSNLSNVVRPDRAQGEEFMPFKSQAQRQFAQLLVEGKISNQTFEERGTVTSGTDRPQRGIRAAGGQMIAGGFHSRGSRAYFPRWSNAWSSPAPCC